MVCLNPLEAFRIKSYRNQIQDEDELFKTSHYRVAMNEEKNQDFVILIAINYLGLLSIQEKTEKNIYEAAPSCGHLKR